MKFVAAFLLLTCIGFAQNAHQPYAGEQARDIKALSPQEVSDLLEGRGMGLAKTAELNHYPGPKHVLEIANELQLSAEQVEKTHAIFECMRAQAVELGRHIVERERELEALFASAQAEAARLARLSEEIGRLQGRLRAVHLQAHLEQRALLNPEQIRKYDQLRGYGADHSASHKH